MKYKKPLSLSNARVGMRVFNSVEYSRFYNRKGTVVGVSKNSLNIFWDDHCNYLIYDDMFSTGMFFIINNDAEIVCRNKK